MKQFIGFTIVFMVTWVGFTMAASATWTGSVSSNFMDPNNWNPALPVAGTTLTIGAGSPNDPVFNADTADTADRPGGLTTTAAAKLTIAGGALYPYSSSTLNGEITQNHGELNVRGNAYIGSGASGTLTLLGGSFTYKNILYIGRNSGGNGTLNIWGGNVWMPGQPVISSNGGVGHISIKNDRFIYCSGNAATFFQNLVTAGTMTTDPGWTILINYDSGTNTTSVTSTRTVGAAEPQPADKAKEIPVSLFKWRPGTSATHSRVFLGTDYTTVLNATTSTAGVYLGSTSGDSWTLSGPLTEGVMYYWRVDTVTATETRKGTVWSFCPVDVMPPRYMEKLGRGVIAMYQGSGNVYVGWRLLATDPADIAFNVYRNGVKLNATPIAQSTNWSDTGVTTAIANIYYVCPVIDDTESAASDSYTLAANPLSARYFTIPLNTVPGGDTYSLRYVYAGDLDGDGEYDFVVLRDNNSLATYKAMEAYRRDGTFLWRVNLGPNIQASYTVVADFDLDGKAEVVTKTSEGTVFGDGTMIGDTDGDGITDYRVIGRQYEIWDGPEFVSVLDGMTGTELSRTDFIPRGDITDWGDGYGHRAGFIRECAAYLDGVHPSIVFLRGPGDFMKMWAWDFVGGQLTSRWTWFNNHHAGLPIDLNWADFHQIRAVDLDGDGKDELNLGGSVIDDDGTPLYGTELTHGDRYQITDFDPDRPGLEAFAIQQNNPTLLGMAYYDAATGTMLQRYYGGPDPWDVGRGDAGDYDPDHKGIEFYSTMNGMYNCKGELIYDEHPFPTLGIWWDADLRREFFASADGAGNNPVINKWNHVTKNSDRLFTIYSDNGSYSVISPDAARPPFLGDIYGDWREEVVLEERDHSKFRVYSTTIPTTHRLYTLMQNPYYRMDVTHKGYIVTTYTDYYLGEGMDAPPTPYIQLVSPKFNPADIVEDGYIDLNDFAVLAVQWLNPPGVPSADIVPLFGDGIVDLLDLGLLAENWLFDGSLQLYMKLDEMSGDISIDSSNYNRSGQLINNPTWALGYSNGALDFDGLDDYVEVAGYKGSLGTVSRTCCAWIKTTGTQKQLILGWGAEANGQKWMFRTETDGTLGVGVWGGYIKTTATVNDGSWHHVAAVLIDDGSPDVSEILLYIDGTLQSTSASNSQSVNTIASQYVTIGAYKNAGVPEVYFRGLIDEVRVYDRALSEIEVQSLSQ